MAMIVHLFDHPDVEKKGAYTMTIRDRVRNIVKSHEYSSILSSEGRANIEKMILMAYYMGREEAAKEVSDKYSEHLKKQRERADNCRYYKLVHSIIGPEKYLYNTDYAGEMTREFGDDLADI